MTRWMYDNIPLYKGMRDSQKWIGLLMIAQLFGWVKFRTVLLQYVKSFDLSVWKQRTISAFFFLVSLVLLHIRNPHMPHAMRQQVLWTTWPEEYFQLKEHLKTFETDGDIVIMPRHSYLVCEWTHTKRQKKTVPLVLDRFTGDERLIKSDNIEAFQLYSNSTNPRSADIEARRKDMQDYKLLTKNDISHVLLIDDCSFDREKEELITAFENDEKLEKVRHE